MRVRVLGSAAGGGLPQWNCRCSLCELARSDPTAVQPRLHASIAVSADDARWVICNLGPDIFQQIERNHILRAHEGLRGTAIAAVVLTGADLDQVLGLLLLREGDALHVYGTSRTCQALKQDLGLLPALAAYCGVAWDDLPLNQQIELTNNAAQPLGLHCRAFPVAGGPPPYAGRRGEGQAGDCVGLLLTDAGSGARLAYLPSCGAIPDTLVALLESVDCVFFDATLWRDDEIEALGVSGRTGRSMQHLPLSGPGGTLDRLRTLHSRRILTHLNNTNPLLLEHGPERSIVAAAGWEVAYDGMEVTL